MPLAAALLLLAAPVTAFFTPSVRLAGGQSVSLHGTGPPVLFSSGLYGLMPRRIYTRLFDELKVNVTLVVLDDAAPVTAATVREAADALAVDRLAFFAHSSFDAAILDSDRVGRAVLCDPVVTPELSVSEGLAAPAVAADAPVLMLNAEKAYGGARTPIPDFLTPRVADADRLVFAGVGHADLLDDPWAELGRRTLPWLESVTPEVRPFREWRFGGGKRDADAVRRRYRAWVARHAVEHLLSTTERVVRSPCSEEAGADELVIDVQQGAA